MRRTSTTNAATAASSTLSSVSSSTFKVAVLDDNACRAMTTTSRTAGMSNAIAMDVVAIVVREWRVDCDGDGDGDGDVFARRRDCSYSIWPQS